jgi:hypothetical protein
LKKKRRIEEYKKLRKEFERLGKSGIMKSRLGSALAGARQSYDFGDKWRASTD